MNKYIKTAAILGIGLTTSIAAYAGDWGHGGHGRHGKAKMEALMELPAETQTLILSTMKEVKEQNEGLREEVRTTREAMKEALTAANFDAEAFNANAEKLESLMAQRFSTFTDAVAKIAPELTQEEREVLAQMGPGHRGPHGRFDKDRNTDSE